LRASFSGGITDGFIAKVDPVNATGANSLVYLTYFGGEQSDQVNAMAVEPSTQRVYIGGVTSSTSTFPLLHPFDSFNNGNEAFVAKVNADGTALFYSSFLGGGAADEVLGIAIDSGGNAYLTGRTNSTDFPRVNGFQQRIGGGTTAFDAFVTKISAVPSTAISPRILYSSFLGGSASDTGRGIALDRKGNVFVAGQAGSIDFPTTPFSFQDADTTVSGGNTDGFVVKVQTTFSDTIGVFRPSTSQFLLRNTVSAGAPDQTATFGQPGDQPLTGDWTGDGTTDVGVFRPSTRQFLLRQLSFVRVCNPVCTLQPTFITITVNFGQQGDLAVVGDWDGDGRDTPGVFRDGQFLLTNSPNVNNSTPAAELNFTFGQAGDIPLAGDWNGDGIDTIGVFRAVGGQFLLRNSNSAGTPDITVSQFGDVGDNPVAGDWNGDGVDTIGIFRNGTFFLTTVSNATVDLTFAFGQSGDLPVAGDWDGREPGP
jgi:hypothetical protein